MAKPILLFKPIFEEVAEEVVSQLLSAEKDVIDIWINTPGGAISAGWSILATLNELEKDANMTVLGDADSFGFFMLLFAKKNKAFDTSSFTVHRAASFWEDIMTDAELNVIKERNDVIRSKMQSRLDEVKFKSVTGYSFDDIFSMSERLDVTLTANQAKEIGLIDEVIYLDVAKRDEIESRYLDQIAALATNEINIKPKKNNMGLFGRIEKDPVFLADIEGKQALYGKLEKGEKIKPVGKDSILITGKFEADGNEVVVVENEITAVKKVDSVKKRIDEIEAKLDRLIDSFQENESEEDTSLEIQALEEKVEKLTGIIKAARLTTSSPELPENEFDQGEDPVKLSAKQRLKAKRKEEGK